MPPDGSTAELISQVGIGGMLEAFGGLLMLVGLFTRPVAFILAGEMAVAYFQFHAPQDFWPIMNGGVNAILYYHFSEQYLVTDSNTGKLIWQKR
jgi:putative oxidoreductase